MRSSVRRSRNAATACSFTGIPANTKPSSVDRGCGSETARTRTSSTSGLASGFSRPRIPRYRCNGPRFPSERNLNLSLVERSETSLWSRAESVTLERF